jgi:hypothetical protein
MPTRTQVKEIFDTVSSLHPGARIKAVGPDGVTFDYPDAAALDTSNWKDKPFTGAA